MIQECYVTFIIHNTDNPSTVRDYLKAKLSKDKLVNSYDVYRDNDDIIVDIKVLNGVYYYPGCRETRWEPGEPSMIEGCLEKEDFLDWMESLLNLEFNDFEVEIDEDSEIPTEEEMLERKAEEDMYYYEEY